MLLFIVLASLAILVVAAGGGRLSGKSGVATVLLVVVNGLLLVALTMAVDRKVTDSYLVAASRFFVLLDLAALCAAQCGVEPRWIFGYGLPAVGFGAVVWSMPYLYSFAPLRVSLYVFLAAMAASFALLSRTPRLISNREIFTLALWFGSAVSFLALGWRAFRLWLVGPMKLMNSGDTLAYLPGEAFYYAPALYLSVFFLFATLFCGLRRLSPHLISFTFVVFSFSLLAMFELTTLLLNWLPPAFQAIYMLGMAFGVVHWVHQRPALLPRTQVAFAVPLILVAFLVTVGWTQAPASPTNAENMRGRPNVLLIVMDTARRESFGMYDYKRSTTPNLDYWAKQGTVFTNAVANSPWTLPSHASMFTGRWCHEHNASFLVPLDESYPTLAEALANFGYETAGFIGNWSICGQHSGLGRGFHLYRDTPSLLQISLASSTLLQVVFGEASKSVVIRPAEEVSDQFLEWLENRDERPFFAFLNYIDPHFPYWVPDPAFDAFADWPEDVRERTRDLWFRSANTFTPTNPEELRFALDTYDGAIHYMDWHIGRVLNRLSENGTLENTLVVITNDHGEHFGEAGLFFHGTSLYRPLIDAPLIVLFPRHVEAPARVESVVGLQDFPATVLEVLRLPNAGRFPGRSWAECWKDADPNGKPRDRVVFSQLGEAVNLEGQLNSKGVIYSLVANGLHYISYFGGREELFDWRKDPRETNDLMMGLHGNDRAAPLRSLLRRALEVSAPEEPAQHPSAAQ